MCPLFRYCFCGLSLCQVLEAFSSPFNDVVQTVTPPLCRRCRCLSGRLRSSPLLSSPLSCYPILSRLRSGYLGHHAQALAWSSTRGARDPLPRGTAHGAAHAVSCPAPSQHAAVSRRLLYHSRIRLARKLLLVSPPCRHCRLCQHRQHCQHRQR